MRPLRRAVLTLLQDEEWAKWSDRDIADRTNTSHPFVAKIRETLTGNISSDKPTERTYTTKHGTTATMRTKNIGKRPERG